MLEIILWIVITGLLVFAFLYLLITGLLKKRGKNISWSLVFLLLSIFTGGWSGYLVFKKTRNTVKELLRPRNGIEIYTALFDAPVNNCVEVTNKRDQAVPRLDCCIWLEFNTCPPELNRIISQHPYEVSRFSAKDTLYMADFYERPQWWKPGSLGDSVIVLHYSDNPSRVRSIFMNRDSAHVFYCDRAD